MKISSILSFIFGLVAGLVIVGCGHAGLKVKIYYLDNAEGGLVRKQSGEVVPFKDATGYRCMNPRDFDAVITTLKQCQIQD